MASLKHLIIITPGFPRDEIDSACIPPLQLFLKRLAHEHPQLTISVIALQYPVQEKEYQWNNLAVYACGGNNSFVKKLLTWKAAVQRFNRIHAQHPVDIIHSLWLTESALLGNYLSKKNAIPHVVTLMGQDAKPENIYQKFLDLKYPKLVAISHFQQKLFDSQNKKKIDAVIPWGLDENDFPIAQVAERDIDILGVGSLIPLKDYSTFIEVARLLSAQFQNLKVTLVGDGPEREKLQAQARSAGLEITFTGTMERKKVLELMMRSKILLHPSLYESQGFVFSEALAAGMYVVSRKVGIANSSEFWRVSATPEMMIAEISRILNTNLTHQRLVPYTVETTVARYLEIYNSFHNSR